MNARRRAALALAILGLTGHAIAADYLVLRPGEVHPLPLGTPAESSPMAGIISGWDGSGTALPLKAPPDWGRSVAGAGGRGMLRGPTRGGVGLAVELEGLTPEHRYILTLNGNPKLPGNDRLPDAVPGMPEERYFDFFILTADHDGKYRGRFGIVLPSGDYATRLYVKDTADFKIILYHDYFPFAVK